MAVELTRQVLINLFRFDPMLGKSITLVPVKRALNLLFGLIGICNPENTVNL